MSAEYICDGCGKRAPAEKISDGHHWGKPYYWFQRSDKDGIQDACSRRCIDDVAGKSGKTSVVLPI